MEERAVGGKEKKYVLYTVVGEEKERAGVGVWVVRILLGTLLLVALAVVPYLSLRLAQVSDRTLVVFQQVPMHNRSKIHHHPTAQKLVQHPLQMVSFKMISNTSSTSNVTNSTLVTLHESAVTLSLLEDTSNISKLHSNLSFEVSQTENKNEESGHLEDSNTTTTTTSTLSTQYNGEGKEEPEDEMDVPQSHVTSSQQKGSPAIKSPNNLILDVITKTDNPTAETTSSSTEDLKVESVSSPTTTSTIISVLRSSVSSTAATVSTIVSSTLRPVTHKLAYVATAASGNHVGGFCVWKTNKNITNWAFFYENIPIEYQSHQDNVDHELRGMLAAVRLWYNQWHDYHVILRSQNQAISKSKHPTRQALLSHLEDFSEGHFTYELEWRLKKDDRLVGLAYCLARLYRDYEYWFKEFEQKVDEVLGPQPWSTAKEDRRMVVSQTLFHTDASPHISNEIGDLLSLDSF